jgi:hypothetical protein
MAASAIGRAFTCYPFEVRGAFLACAFSVLAGCETYVATDGRAYVRDASHSAAEPWIDALYASAVHDLRCERTGLRSVANYVEHAGLVHDASGLRADSSLTSVPPLAAVEGCGQRVTYTVAHDRLVITNLVVVVR